MSSPAPTYVPADARAKAIQSVLARYVRKGVPNDHGHLVSVLLAMGYVAKDFAARVADGVRIAAGDEPDATPMTVKEWRLELGLDPAFVVPDAYRVQITQHLVDVVEVEITSAMPARKLEAYADLWWALDFHGWELTVFSVDRYANVSAVDCTQVYYERLGEQGE